MGIFGFGNKREGSLMDVIRCDKTGYLIWKWSPNGEESRKENAIRWGSSLRVKMGEVALLCYKQGKVDFVEGPYDEILKTANLPVLTSIVGAAYGGNSPFQAEIYFINKASVINASFYIDNFRINDSNYSSFDLPASSRCSLRFSIKDPELFVRAHGLHSMEIDDLVSSIKPDLTTKLKDTLAKSANVLNIPAFQLDGYLDALSTYVRERLAPVCEESFALNLNAVNIEDVVLDNTSSEYKRAKLQQSKAHDVIVERFDNIKNHEKGMTDFSLKNLEETTRIRNEETQRRQKLQTESEFFGAHVANLQAGVANTAAESLGMMNANMGFGDGGGMNPAGMMAGMMMGGTVAGGMSSMMGNMMGNMAAGINQQMPSASPVTSGPSTPPPPPSDAIPVQFHIVLNGQQSGPFNMAQLQQMVVAGQLTPNTYAWKQGMSGWQVASSIPELASLFGAVPPPIPTTPPIPPAI